MPDTDPIEEAAESLDDCQEQLEVAKTIMKTRPVIDQAKGVIMGENRCTPDEAFEMLSKASQRSNRKLRDIASDIVEGVAEESR